MAIGAITSRTPEGISVQGSFGPPLPASAIIFEFGASDQARIIYANAKVTKPLNGALLQSISLHDETGTSIYVAGLVPLLLGNSGVLGPLTVLNIAGPEQLRVPFFAANALVGTWPKDCYALPGYTLRFNNIGQVAGNSAVVTVVGARGYIHE
jgi:hypothetical protein